MHSSVMINVCLMGRKRGIFSFQGHFSVRKIVFLRIFFLSPNRVNLHYLLLSTVPMLRGQQEREERQQDHLLLDSATKKNNGDPRKRGILVLVKRCQPGRKA